MNKEGFSGGGFLGGKGFSFERLPRSYDLFEHHQNILNRNIPETSNIGWTSNYNNIESREVTIPMGIPEIEKPSFNQPFEGPYEIEKEDPEKENDYPDKSSYEKMRDLNNRKADATIDKQYQKATGNEGKVIA